MLQLLRLCHPVKVSVYVGLELGLEFNLFSMLLNLCLLPTLLLSMHLCLLPTLLLSTRLCLLPTLLLSTRLCLKRLH